jgi:hypothetical protein
VVQIVRYEAFVVHLDRQNLADFWPSTRKQPLKGDTANRHSQPVRGVADHSWMLALGRHTLDVKSRYTLVRIISIRQ